MFEKLQRLGKAFMIPIAVLPIAGLMLGIGSAFTNGLMIETYGLTWLLGVGTFLYYVLSTMAAIGNVVFGNLPLIFAVGIASGLALQEKGAAGLSAAISFVVMHSVIGKVLSFLGHTPETTSIEYFVSQGMNVVEAAKQANVYGYELGMFSVRIGVLGGIIIGIVVAFLTNKYYDKKMPEALSFFSGVRFVPIISVLAASLIGAVIPFVWPYVHLGISTFAEFFGKTGPIGVFFYGFFMRLLNIFGLHHAIYPLFWFTSLGGEMEVAGRLVQGGQNIFFAQLADPNTLRFSVEGTKFFTGGLLFSAALTSFLTGITEPIEFTFLFVAPALYGIHALLEGIAYAAYLGGAKGIRANSVEDIKEIKRNVNLPLIGIIKKVYGDCPVFITPTMKEIDALVEEGVEIIALDATDRLRPDGETIREAFPKIREKYPHQLFMADCSTFSEEETAEALGFDFLGTTLSGYTDYTKERKLPDVSLMEEIVNKLHTPLIAEGGISTPEELRDVMSSGAFCAVVGSAITRPLEITKRFMEAVKK